MKPTELYFTYKQEDAIEISKRIIQAREFINQNKSKEAIELLTNLIDDFNKHNGLDIVSG